MARSNCWEVMECGCEPGGENADYEGPCPASVSKMADGFCGGVNGGRACVYILNTRCGDTLHTHKSAKMASCSKCKFYTLLRMEHSTDLTFLKF